MGSKKEFDLFEFASYCAAVVIGAVVLVIVSWAIYFIKLALF